MSKVQPMSSCFGYHEWCLKANVPANTVVYVTYPEPSAVSFLYNKLHKLYVVTVPHLFFKHAVDSFLASCRFVPWLALPVCWYGISALFKRWKCQGIRKGKVWTVGWVFHQCLLITNIVTYTVCGHLLRGRTYHCHMKN